MQNPDRRDATTSTWIEGRHEVSPEEIRALAVEVRTALGEHKLLDLWRKAFCPKLYES